MISKEPFIKLMRSQETIELMKSRNSYILLSLIALRTKRTNGLSVDNLEIGEARIGDYKACGLTRQEYRTAIKKLEKWELVTFKTTNRGTIARIINTNIFDVNIEEPDTPVDTPAKPKNNDKNKCSISFEKFWKAYPVKSSKNKSSEKWKELNPNDELVSIILSSIERKIKERNVAPPGKFIANWPNPFKWLEEKRWQDENGEPEIQNNIEKKEPISQKTKELISTFEPLEKIFPEALKKLQKELQEYSFSAFIKPLKVVKIEKNLITLFCSGINTCKWVKDNYTLNLEKSLKKKIKIISTRELSGRQPPG